MIDTIGIVIECSTPAMLNFRNKVECLLSDISVSDKEIEMPIKDYNTRLVHISRLNKKTREREDKEFLKGKIWTSSEYGIVWFYDKVKMRLKFDFSVPKYLYGNNVKMWMPHERISDFDKIDIVHMSRELRRIIVEVCLKFSNSNRLEEREAYFIKVTRMDFCFNYLFREQRQRDICFNALKEQKKKYARDKDDIYYNFKNETIMYKVRGYSVKYYKKDKEFHKYGKKLVIGKYGIDYADMVEEIASRTLRFEVTFFNEKISKVWRKYIDVNLFHFKTQDTNDYKSINVHLFTLNEIPKIREFFLSTKEVKFNSHFLSIMLNKFIDEINDWRIESYISDETFYSKLERAKILNPKMRTNKLIWYWNSIRNTSLQDLVSKGIIHRNTVTNVEKAFDKIGINLKSISKQEFSGMPTFSDYISGSYRL